MKTIAVYIKEKIKNHQRFIYNQIVHIKRYRMIVLGPFDQTEDTQYPFENFYNINRISDLKTFFQEMNVIDIHAHHGSHANEILPVAVEHNIPLIVSIRGRDGSAEPEIIEQSMKRYESLKEHGALFIPVCEYLADGLKQMGFPEEKIHVLYGGIELDLFPFIGHSLPNKGEIRILSVGRLVEKKGHETLIYAFNLIHFLYPNARLHIIGEGKDEQKLRALIDRLMLNDVVILRGALTSPKIAEELKKAHIFCLASHKASSGDVEGIPNAIKEAMAIGIPIVTTEHGGIPEMMKHKKTGYLTPEKDVLELARGFLYYLDNPELWEGITCRARSVIEEKFNFNKQLKEQERLYSLLDPSKKKGKSKK